jgi:hypothetical protein
VPIPLIWGQIVGIETRNGREVKIFGSGMTAMWKGFADTREPITGKGEGGRRSPRS